MDLDFSNYIGVYGIALLVFLAIDLTWLGWVAKDLYRKIMKKQLAKKPNWLAAIIFYNLFVIGLVYFALGPALEEDSLGRAMISGSLFGLFTYGTYEFTSWAVIKDWPAKIVWIDLAWGVFLSLSVSTITYSIYTGLVS